MIKVGVLKNESVVFDSVKRHLVKKYFFFVENSVNCSVRTKVSAGDGQRTGKNKILVEGHSKWLFSQILKSCVPFLYSHTEGAGLEPYILCLLIISHPDSNKKVFWQILSISVSTLFI